MHPNRMLRLAALCGVILAGCAAAAASAGLNNPQARAQSIIRKTGTEGGLIVQVGCSDGKLLEALRESGNHVVHGLDRSVETVRTCRRYLRSRDTYGPVSVRQWTGNSLPLVRNTVDLVIKSPDTNVSTGEIMRVLAPGGAAYIRTANGAEIRRNSWPDDIDEWTHYLHDPTNNAVSRDQQVGPPRHMQWRARPLWSRYHHTLASISTVVSSEGRLFYVADQAPPASLSIEADWHIIARNAFNGKLLWKKELPSWAWYKRRFRSGPPQLPRLMVAAQERVYAPLGLGKPVSALKASNGQVIRTFEGTARAEEILLAGDTLLVVRGQPTPEQAVNHPAFGGKYQFPNKKAIAAVDVRSGERLWQWGWPEANPFPMTLASDGDRVFFQTPKGINCLDLDSGRTRWHWDEPDGAGPRNRVTYPRHVLVVSDGVVLCTVGNKLTALAAETGEKLWDAPAGAGFHAPADLFVIDGNVWQGSHPRDSVAPPPKDDFDLARNVHTGKVQSSNQLLVGLQTAGHHHRCYREKATERYIITGKRGVEMMDLQGSNHSRNNWIRGSCQYGIMPANGLIYAPPHCCGCYMEAKLYGFWATAPKRPHPGSGKPRPRLRKGPAYGEAEHDSSGNDATDWPTYRHDVTRSGATDQQVPSDLSRAWQTRIGQDVTPPVVADGLAVVGSTTEHRITGLDASDGSVEWTFTPGGPVDLPPTLHEGLVLFGCRDGHVYCLRASDGRLVWRFRAAPRDRRTLDRERLESVWPVPGSVLMMDGTAYVSAGRSTYLDGGIRIYGLDPHTGEVVHRNRVRSEHAGISESRKSKNRKTIAQNVIDNISRRAPDQSDSFSMRGGALNDVLVSDGYSIYIKHMRFGPDLQRRETSGRHLFSTSRLLNSVELHRSHWVLGTGDFSRIPVAYPWIANNRKGWGKVRLGRPYGVMLAFESDTAWCVWRRMEKPGYTIFARSKKPFRRNPEGRRDFRTFDSPGRPEMKWKSRLMMRPRAMLKAGDNLFFGGAPDQSRADDPLAAYRGKEGGLLHVYAADKGKKQASYQLPSPVVWDGMAAVERRIYLSTENGRLLCLGGKAK